MPSCMVLLRNLRDSFAGLRASRGDYKLAETLLKAIREHAVQGYPPDRERFRSLVAELNRRMVSNDDDPELMMIAGAAQQALQLYSSETNAFWHSQTADLQGIVSSITSALAQFGDRHSQAAERLMTLEHSLEAIAGIDDLRVVRQKIEECVTALRIEHQHQRETQKLVSQSLPAKPGARQADLVTGLETRQSAEVKIAESLRHDSEGVHLALFVVHRIRQINSRYGHAVGDEMLKTVLRHIAANLHPKDQIFRWSGPAFLALVRRDETPDAVTHEMRRIASYKIDRELEIRDRGVMVQLSASVCLIALKSTSQFAVVSAELDHFVSSHLER